MKIFRGVKVKFLILAGLAIFLIAGGTFAQSDAGGIGIDQMLFGETIESLMTASTGKMTDEIDLEIVARISVCYKGTAMSEAEFRNLVTPYNVTGVEFAAYHWQHLRGGKEASYFLEKLASRMPALIAAVKAKGCKFGTNPEPPVLEKCNGYCAIGNVCPVNAINKGLSDCQPHQQCHSCGFFGLKKCCEYLPTTCCEYPKPVTDCSIGLCTYNDCPEGTQDAGLANCGEENDCETCWGFGKCCKKKQTKCCMAVNYTKCAQGTCQNSDACPKGSKNIGMADCGSYEKTHSCGFFGLFKCKDSVPKTCCLPK